MDSWDNLAYEAAPAYQKTAALIAAIKLDIVTLIGGGAASSDALAEKTAASSRGMRILCDFLTVMGLLAKQDGAYSVSEPAKRYLDPFRPTIPLA
jgi:Dimerisation domain